MAWFFLVRACMYVLQKIFWLGNYNREYVFVYWYFVNSCSNDNSIVVARAWPVDNTKYCHTTGTGCTYIYHTFSPAVYNLFIRQVHRPCLLESILRNLLTMGFVRKECLCISGLGSIVWMIRCTLLWLSCFGIWECSFDFHGVPFCI